LGFGNRYLNIFNKKHIGGKIFRKKGHLLKRPSQQKIYEIRKSLIRKARLDQWKITDNSSFYLNEDKSWPQRSIGLIDTIVISITDNEHCNASKLYEIDSECAPGITCHLFVGSNSIVEKTSEFTNIINHTPGISTRSLNVTVQYKAKDATLPPPIKTLTSLEKLLTLLCLHYKLDPEKAIVGQWEAMKKIPMLKPIKPIPKNSPGVLFPLDNIKKNVVRNLQNKLRYAGLYFGKVLPYLSKQSIKAMIEFDSDAIELMYYKFKLKQISHEDDSYDYDRY